MRIAVVVPAHNEAELIGRCLASIDVATVVARAQGHAVSVYVVCDACDDGTETIVADVGHRPIVVAVRNVGAVRAHGASIAMREGAEWLAFTDADSFVAPDWLTAQLALHKDVVCGTIQVDDWETYGEALELHFARTYFDRDGHAHIHGANLGMSAEVYTRVGGFDALANSEDVGIVRALESMGASIAWSNAPRVTTSARANFRATAGFGATLAAVAARQPEFSRTSDA